MANDMSIVYGIVVFFFLIGIITPYMNEAFDSSIPVNSPDSIQEDFKEENIDSVNFIDILKSIFKMFTWTFGDLPVWFDLIILTPLRILLVYALIRVIMGS